MERRDFFRRSLQKAATHAEAAKARAQEAPRWVRPPHALPELHFLVTCTRCDECVKACPHQVIFKLSEQTDRLAAGTPALDLLNRGCHMCPDTPCVTACETGALKSPEAPNDTIPPYKLAIATIDEKTCLPYSGPECGACASSCPVPGALKWGSGGRPVIDQTLCSGCAMCREACIVIPGAVQVSTVIRE
jgi:ferredoxin-type protein NapG